MNKTFIFHVFRNDIGQGTKLWFSFTNRKAAQNCCDYFNGLEFSKKYNVAYYIVKEELYSEW